MNYELKLRKNNGQMLIEALVALSIFLISLTAITVTVVTAVSNSRFAQDQNAANKYAQDGIEQLKSRGFTQVALFGNSIQAFKGDNTFSLAGTDQVNIDSKYIRTATFTENAPPCLTVAGKRSIRVEVKVRWNSPKCTATTFCHSSIQTTCITQSGGY